MSRPESVSSRMASSGSSMAIWRISLRFFSPPEKPSFRWRSPKAGSMPSRFIHSIIVSRTSSTDRSSPSPGRQGLAQELDDRDAGDLLGVLEGQEHPGLAPHVGRPGGDVLALEADGARGDLVGGVAEQRAGQRRLARAVRAHQGVDLAFGPR